MSQAAAVKVLVNLMAEEMTMEQLVDVSKELAAASALKAVQYYADRATAPAGQWAAGLRVLKP
jgi:uncharacterized protein (DUF433 family)